MSAHISAESEHRIEVYIQHFIPVVVGELVSGVAALDAAAVEQDVDLVAVCDDFFDEGRDGVAGGEVGGVDLGFAAEGLDLFAGGLVGFVALE